MKIIAIVRAELQRLTSTGLARLALVALITVPLLYGVVAMLLVAAAIEAFWSSQRWITPAVKFGVGAFCWAAVIAYVGWQGRPPRRRNPATR